MRELNIKEMAQSAIHWASGSWGQGQYDKPKYDDKTMGYLWAEIARIAKENSDKHFDVAIAELNAIKNSR
jgi:hypothetical protein